MALEKNTSKEVGSTRLETNGTDDSLDSTEMMEIMKVYFSNVKYFDPLTEALLIVAYTLLIVFGAVGNGLVCYVVLRNPHMRTPRNIFIINLAISDLTLCIFTQPLNLYKLIQYEWGLGSFMCKFVTMFQGTNVFVSTISITAIALDRFQVIVYPTKDSMKKVGGAIALVSIWLISFLMASPFLLFSVLRGIKPVPELDFYINRCIEDTALAKEKRAYSVAQMVVQYVLPIVIVTVVHLRICNKLRYRMVNQNAAGAAARSTFQRQKDERNTRRKRKTNILLASIALVFGLSWLPLTIFNLISEFNSGLFLRITLRDAKPGGIDINLTYAICHLLVLCSACINPVLYGWLNDNFRTEFMKVLYCTCCKQIHALGRRMACCQGRQQGVPTITFTAANGKASCIVEDPRSANDLTVYTSPSGNGEKRPA